MVHVCSSSVSAVTAATGLETEGVGLIEGLGMMMMMLFVVSMDEAWTSTLFGRRCLGCRCNDR